MGAGASAMPSNPKEVSDEQIKDHIWGQPGCADYADFEGRVEG